MIDFDFKNPDYAQVFCNRARMLSNLRANPDFLYQIKLHYKNNIAQFISDWGMTLDPRNANNGLPSKIPFILFDRQKELIDEIIYCWKNNKNLIVEKSRDMGVSWVCIATFCSLALFNNNIIFGFGSRKQEYVDKIGDQKSIFERSRFFLENLPVELRGGFDRNTCSKLLLIHIPATGSKITGEAGDNIGRGDRTSAYCIDEAAHIERPHLIEASLSNTTNCRIDVSTPKGMGNPFAEKRHSGKVRVFTVNWRDDPRKSQEWYEEIKKNLDPVTLAQEVDLDYSASVEGVLIPSAWVNAAVDSHIKLGFEISGPERAGFDLADEGKDLNAIAIRKGIQIIYVDEWSGKGSDIFYTVERAIDESKRNNCFHINYDCEGLGTGVRGDERVAQKDTKLAERVRFYPFRSSGGIMNPKKKEFDDKNANKDLFANLKAQVWWGLRMRFQKTYRAVTECADYDKDELISINSKMPNLNKLIIELSQPTYSKNGASKIVIDKAPNESKSPNLADAVMMCYYNTPKIEFNSKLLSMIN